MKTIWCHARRSNPFFNRPTFVILILHGNLPSGTSTIHDDKISFVGFSSLKFQKALL